MALGRNTMREIDAATRLCAVIGNPVGHSLSPKMHNAAFDALGLNYVYLAFQVTDVAACLQGMRALPSFRGMSVTIPHKAAVIPYLDAIDPLAQHIGSVNTITNEDGRLVGSSTDGPGTLRAFAEAGIELNGKRIVFLGAGGAVRAVAFAIATDAAPTSIAILGRNIARVGDLATEIAAKTGANVSAMNIATDLHHALAECDVLIQGTPVGMYPERLGESSVPATALRPDMIVFDMVYRPLKTRLIEDAEAAGCAVVLGLEMLVNQAVLQFERWTGHAAPVKVMRDALRAALDFKP
jgi:shikimate dehydrogenase